MSTCTNSCIFPEELGRRGTDEARIRQSPPTPCWRVRTSPLFLLCWGGRFGEEGRRARGLNRRRQAAGSSNPVEVGQYFVTGPVLLLTHSGITTTCREYSAPRYDSTTEAKNVLGDNTIFGSIQGAKITLHHGRSSMEVQIGSFCEDEPKTVGGHKQRRGQIRH